MNMGTFDLENVKIILASFSAHFSKLGRNSKTNLLWGETNESLGLRSENIRVIFTLDISRRLSGH